MILKLLIHMCMLMYLAFCHKLCSPNRAITSEPLYKGELRISAWRIEITQNYTKREGSAISRQNLNENIETLYLAPMQLCYLPGFYRIS